MVALRGDEAYMDVALALAERGRGRTSPNPMVGAVIVSDEGVIVGRGAHERAGEAHAEIHAIESARDLARGATLYCTLEPCSHVGRTGPCAPQVVGAGIRRAVIAIEDPNPLVAGRGLAYLRDHGVEVAVGVRRDAAARLNRAFFTFIRERRPFVTLKAALSLDAKVSAGEGERTSITGREAARLVHHERAEIDALAIGSGTVLVDDPLLTPRGIYRERPLTRVIFDRRLRTPPDARIFSTTDAGPIVIVTGTSTDVQHKSRAQELRAVGARIAPVDPSDDFVRAALAHLGGQGVTSIVVEGGPTLQRGFWQAGMVDRIELFVAPAMVGPHGVHWDVMPDGAIAGLHDLTARPVGTDVLIEGYVHGTD